jgi:hypothetical protein
LGWQWILAGADSFSAHLPDEWVKQSTQFEEDL